MSSWEGPDPYTSESGWSSLRRKKQVPQERPVLQRLQDGDRIAQLEAALVARTQERDEARARYQEVLVMHRDLSQRIEKSVKELKAIAQGVPNAKS